MWPILDAASHPRISLISLTAFIAQINHGREQSPGRAAGPVSDSPSRSGLLSCTQVLSDSNTLTRTEASSAWNFPLTTDDNRKQNRSRMLAFKPFDVHTSSGLDPPDWLNDAARYRSCASSIQSADELNSRG